MSLICNIIKEHKDDWREYIKDKYPDIRFKCSERDPSLFIFKYRIGANLEPASYNLKSVKESIISGKTCIPAGIKSKNDWVDGESFYQIFMVDIDNVVVEGRTRTKLTTADSRHI